MNGRDVARKLGIGTQKAGWLLRTGRIKAERGRIWNVDRRDFDHFAKRNHARAERLKAEYVRRYWAGYSIEELQRMAARDFIKREIYGSTRDFAEHAVYESLVRDRRRNHE